MNENKFLLVKGIAGLGNRMLSALTGILYAKLSGRKLIIDWRDSIYSNDGSNAFNSYFQCSLVNPDENIPQTDSVSPLIWSGHLRESALDMRLHYGNLYDREDWKQFSIDLTRLDYEDDVVIMWTFIDRVDFMRCHFRGEFKEFEQISNKEILRKLLREDLNLHPQIQQRVDNFASKFLSRKTLGVHVRYTDHRVRLRSIINMINKLLKLESGLQIFLATDNIQIKKLFDENYQNVITTEHWYPAPGLTIHQNPSCPDPLENGKEALVDLYLLAKCDYLVIDTSSMFAYVAVLLTDSPNHKVFNINSRERGGKRSIHNLLLSWKLLLKLRLFSWEIWMISFIARLRRYLKI